MASQLGTGKALGTVTGAEEAKRLIGGTPQVGAGTPIGGRSFDLPALRPAASPVNTYFESRGPILGGPVVIPRPPELPAPSQDMAALAKSLGSFSTVLDAMGETYVAAEKMRQDRADIAGKRAAEDIAAKFPGQRLAEIRDQLYRKASAGDLEARAAYERLQSVAGSHLVLAYTNRHLEMAATRNEISTAPDRWAQMTEVPDDNGNMVSKESLPPNHPLILRAQQQLIRINTSDPVIYKQFEAQIYATHSNLTTAQVKLHNEYNYRNALGSFQIDLQSMLTDPKMTDEKVQLGVEQALDQARRNLGPEYYSRFLKQIKPMFKAFQNKAALEKNPLTGVMQVNTQLAQRLSTRNTEILMSLRAGPNGETLQQRLSDDGISLVTDFARESMQDSAALRNAVRGSSEAIGQDAAINLIDSLNLRGLAYNSEQFNLGIIAATERGRELFKNDPVAKAAFEKELSSFSSTAEGLGSARVQENAKQAAAKIEMSKADPEEKLKLLENLAAQPGVDPTTIQPSYERVKKDIEEENKPYAQENAKWIRETIEKREGYYLRPGIGGRESRISNDELDKLLAEERNLKLTLKQIASTERAKGKSEADVQQTLARFRRDYAREVENKNEETERANRPPVIEDISKFKDAYDGWFKSVPGGLKDKLNKTVPTGKVVMNSVLKEEVARWLSTGKLSPEMEFVIKSAGYGKKPGEFLELQWKNNLPGVPFPTMNEEEKERLRDLRLSSAAPPAPAPSNNYLPHSLATSFLNTLTGTNPAAAATMPESFRRLPTAARIETPVVSLAPNQIALAGSLDVNKLRRAIVGKESGGSFTVVNPDSGALGYGQVMPANVPSWTKKHFGKSLTPRQFLANPQAQLAVVNGQIAENYQQQIAAGYRGDIAIRRAAAIWYSGDGDLYNNNRKQITNGREYPSVREYTLDILRRYKQGG